MALPNGLYAIVNRASGNVLDFTGNAQRNLFVMSWHRHGNVNQQWTLADGVGAGARTFTNGRRAGGVRTLDLNIVEGGAPPGAGTRVAGRLADPPRNWFINPVDGGFTIRTNVGDAGLLALTVVDTDGPIGGDGARVTVENFVAGNLAQIWDFIAPPLRPGNYTIRNNNTETVLDLSGDLPALPRPVMGWESHGADNQKWILRIVPNPADPTVTLYTLRSAGNGPFLTPQDDADGAHLIGTADAVNFNIERVVGTHSYQIRRIAGGGNFAVNILGDNPANGANVVLQDGDAQNWAFIAVAALN